MNVFNIVKWEYKNNLVVCMISIALLLVVIPLLDVHFIWKNGVTSESFEFICGTLQSVVPILAVAWVYFVKREWTDAKGKELLVMHFSKMRSRILHVFSTVVVFIIQLEIVVLFHRIWFSEMITAGIWLIAQTLFFCGLYNVILRLVNNTGIAFIFVLLYFFATRFIYAQCEGFIDFNFRNSGIDFR